MELEKRPVLGGVVALVVVALVVGLVAGGAVLLGSRVLGLGEAASSGSGGGNEPSAGDTLYLPRPSETEQPEDPLVTLNSGAQGDGERSDDSDDSEEAEGSEKKKGKKKKDGGAEQISLSASQTSVSPMGRIDLTGTYQGGEGAVLQVQRLEGGSWSDFPVTASVSNQTFQTYVQSSQAGKNKFRVVDTDTEKASNPVTVSIG